MSSPRFEQRARPLACSLEVHEAKLPVFDCIYHFHPEIELIAIHDSHGLAVLDGQIEKFQPGDVFLLGSMAPHSFTNRRKESKGVDWTHYTVAFCRPDFLGGEGTILPEASGIRRLIGSGSSFALEGDLRRRVERKMKEMPRAGGMAGLALLLDILTSIVETPANLRKVEGGLASEGLQRHDTERLAKVHRFIHDHCTEEIDLAAVAKCASMAASSFSRWFHQKTGKTFKDYLNEVRVLEACSRLVLSDEPVTSLCYDCGFNNLSNFNRRFRRIKGCTPSQFRERWNRNSGSPGVSPFGDAPIIAFENDGYRSTAYR